MSDYLIGIDGGGSKTDFLLCDLNLKEIGRRFDSRSNPNDIGIENVITLLESNIKSLLEENGLSPQQIKGIFAGIAGLTNQDYREKAISSLKKLLPNAKVDASHDGINVLYGAFPKTDGAIVICGTGSSCFVKKGNEIIRIGGYGSFDLIGNGYEIGRAGIAYALKTFDGREKETLLSQLIKEKCGETDLLKALDSWLLMTKNQLASYARVVFEAAEKGDKVALKIISDNMDYIAGLINRAGDYFENHYQVALAGGILKNQISIDMLNNKLSKRVSLIQSENPPSFGAAAKAFLQAL